MLFTWIIVLALEFCVGLVYFTISEPVHITLNKLLEFGTPEGIITAIIICFNLAFVVLAVGLLVYAVLRSVRKENDTYST